MPKDWTIEAIRELLPEVQYRVVDLDALDVRAAGDGEAAPRIKGHAAVFDKPSLPLGGGFGPTFVEKVAPGAFKKTLTESDVRALWNHDPNFVLGRQRSRTLKLREDKVGLAVDIEPPETTWASDLIVTMQRGDVDQMSFAFQTVKDLWEEERDPDGNLKQITRTLKEVKLIDVSVVTFPAYPQTDAAARGARCLACALAAPMDGAPEPADADPHSEAHDGEPIPMRDHSASGQDGMDDRADHSNGQPDEPAPGGDHSLDARYRRLDVAEKVLV